MQLNIHLHFHLHYRIFLQFLTIRYYIKRIGMLLGIQENHHNLMFLQSFRFHIFDRLKKFLNMYIRFGLYNLSCIHFLLYCHIVHYSLVIKFHFHKRLGRDFSYKQKFLHFDYKYKYSLLELCNLCIQDYFFQHRTVNLEFLFHSHKLQSRQELILKSHYSHIHHLSYSLNYKTHLELRNHILHWEKLFHFHIYHSSFNCQENLQIH